MFARRTQWDTRPNPLAVLLEEKRRLGKRVLDLSVSNPTRCGFSYLPPDILRLLAQPSSLVYEPHPRGLLSAREAIARYYASSLNIHVHPENILLTAGTSEAYATLFRLLCNPGDHVAIPCPSYPLLDYLCDLTDVSAVHYRLVYDGRWCVDLDSVHRVIQDGARTVVLVHPNNPTGSLVTPDEFTDIVETAEQTGCSLIVDEVFSPFGWNPNGEIPSTLRWNPTVLTCTLSGISKLLGLPQLKLSWMVLRGAPRVQSAALERLDVMLDTFLSVNTPVQHALPDLLALAPVARSALRDRLQENLATIHEACNDSPVTLLTAEAGWYAILQLPRTRTDNEWAMELLDRSDLVTQPGHFFNLEQESCLVLSLICPTRSTREGIQTLLRYVQSASLPGNGQAIKKI